MSPRGRERGPLPGALLEATEIPLGVEAVFPLLGEDDEETLAHREPARRWPAGSLDRLRVAGQGLLGETVDDLPDGGHPIPTQFEDRVQRRPRGAVAGNAG